MLGNIYLELYKNLFSVKIFARLLLISCLIISVDSCKKPTLQKKWVVAKYEVNGVDMVSNYNGAQFPLEFTLMENGNCEILIKYVTAPNTHANALYAGTWTLANKDKTLHIIADALHEDLFKWQVAKLTEDELQVANALVNGSQTYTIHALYTADN